MKTGTTLPHRYAHVSLGPAVRVVRPPNRAAHGGTTHTAGQGPGEPLLTAMPPPPRYP